MTDKTPQFPGKPAQTGSQQPTYKDMVCPLLSAGEVARQLPPSNLVTLGPDQKKGLTPIACMGPKCAFFIELMAPDGRTVSGCAPTHLVQLGLTLNGMVHRFIQAAEAGAAAEAAEAAREAEANKPAEAAVNKPAETPAVAPAAPTTTP